MSIENNEEIGIYSTCNFGSTDETSKCYDIRNEVGKKIIHYKLSKIKCQIKSKDSIYGIQFIYRNINTCKEETLIDVKSTDYNLIEQEMSMNGEELVDLRTWLSEEIKLIGFEVTTNKGRTQKFGYGNDEQLRMCPDLVEKDRVIVGFGVSADEKKGVTSLYAYYINKATYSFHLYRGVLSLRTKIKNEEYRKKIRPKLDNLSEQNKILYRICSLPDNQFFNIIKYALS